MLSNIVDIENTFKGGSKIYNQRNTFKRESFVIYGCGVLFAVLAFIYYHINGYPNVITLEGDLGIPTSPIYMIPIFIPYGILLGELFVFYKMKDPFWAVLITQCFLITIIAIMRLFLYITISGHAVIISLYLLHQIYKNNYQYSLRLIIGVFIFLETVFDKIFIWNDLITLLFGLLFGFGIWVIGFILKKRKTEAIDRY